MNKGILWLIGLLFATSFTIVSCSETDGVEDTYVNWEERNQKYIDSIAVVANANLGDEPGQWKVIRSFKLGPLQVGEQDKVTTNVYCKILEVGEGATPLYSDTVGVDFRGKLINGTVFDQSYTGELDPELTVSYKTTLGSVIIGWPTALMQMKVGDRWEVYIPYTLAYGTGGSGTILGYSTLMFDMYLSQVYPLKGNGRAVEDEALEGN